MRANSSAAEVGKFDYSEAVQSYGGEQKYSHSIASIQTVKIYRQS